MMKLMLKFLLCFVLLWSSQEAFSQKGNKKLYQDFLEEGSEMVWSDYHKMLEKTSDKKYILKIFYPETRVMTHFITYSDKGMKTKEGPYREWYDNGHKWQEGVYENDQKTGDWTFYSFDNGSKKRYGEYRKDLEEGPWVDLDSLGRTTIESNFLRGKLHGEYKRFNENGEVISLAIYKNGEMISETKLENGVPIEVMKAAEVFPHLKECKNEDEVIQKACSSQKMLESIYANIRYPEDARNKDIQGMAILRFVVEKDGSINDVVALRGLCRDIEAECIRVIGFIPPWNPGLQEGEPVRVQFTLPLKFKLE